MQAAIVGAGPAGILHALSFRSHHVPVRVVFDPDRARSRALATICGAEVAECIADVAASDSDCISICSPPRLHVEQAVELEREGRILFVEKPVAVTKHELARLLRVPSCVGVLQWRAGRAIRVIRRAIGEGLFGS
ncbi:MAG: Gfo/Idh/MocA family oxidoreductase, partial [Polyangiaceae bacterium]